VKSKVISSGPRSVVRRLRPRRGRRPWLEPGGKRRTARSDRLQDHAGGQQIARPARQHAEPAVGGWARADQLMRAAMVRGGHDESHLGPGAVFLDVRLVQHVVAAQHDLAIGRIVAQGRQEGRDHAELEAAEQQQRPQHRRQSVLVKSSRCGHATGFQSEDEQVHVSLAAAGSRRRSWR
jgi:hypothetical protein